MPWTLLRWGRRRILIPASAPVVTATDGRVVGEGFHRGAGHPHAEVEALALAGENAYGGTAWVTLEPCDHAGRTGPCSRALLDAGVNRVVFGQADPHPEAAGGAARLRAGGVAVEGGVSVEQARELNRAWTFAVTRGRPRRGVEVRGDLGRTICCRRRHESVDYRTGGSSGCAPPPGRVGGDHGGYRDRARRRSVVDGATAGRGLV